MIHLISIERYYMQLSFLLALLVLSGKAFTQVGIGTSSPNNSAMLEISSPDKGLLLPRLALTNPLLQ
ncbi:MAG: hypothetical protein H7Y86_17375 [Rhizobacter sp.]|nr:hypothetical protein [Ferruginibacter sp.]